MQGRGGGGGPPADNSLAPLWIMVGLAIAAGLLWYFAHAYIVHGFFKVKLFEISLINLVFHSENLTTLKNTIDVLPPEDVSFAQLHYVAAEVGRYIRFPCIVIILLFAFLIYRSSTAGSYKNNYTMDQLLLLESENWPQLKPVVGLDLVNQNIEEGPWAMAPTPMYFAKKHGLIIEETVLPGEEEFGGPRVLANLDRGKANAIFTLQLGPVFTGLAALSMPERALFAIFAARANEDRDLADKLTMQLASKFDNKKNTTDYTGVNDACSKYVDSTPVQRVFQAHAYTLTVMAAMLEIARYDGVLAPADFIWLKPVDRRLWFMLNAVGRVTPSTEVAGPFAHWKVEKELQRKVLVPMVEEATNALEVALSELIYKKDD